MWDLIVAPENRIFGIAMMLMLMLGLLEIISVLVGGISEWLDNLLPDSLAEAARTEVGMEMAGAGVFIRFLSWLYVGKIPLLILMVVFLAVFSLLGYFIQNIWHQFFGFYLNGWLAAWLVWFTCLPVVRMIAAAVYKIMPKDETTAVDQESLVGRVGVVILGEARIGSPAQAKVKDQHGQQHYVMVEPDVDGEVLKQGEAVLLISVVGVVFRAIANPSGSLID